MEPLRVRQQASRNVRSGSREAPDPMLRRAVQHRTSASRDPFPEEDQQITTSTSRTGTTTRGMTSDRSDVPMAAAFSPVVTPELPTPAGQAAGKKA
jgi:hypothetical protein